MTNYKHLTLDDRNLIAQMLSKRSSFMDIASAIGKNPVTISREVRKHSCAEKSGTLRIGYNACIHRKDCQIPRLSLCSICHSDRYTALTVISSVTWMLSSGCFLVPSGSCQPLKAFISGSSKPYAPGSG